MGAQVPVLSPNDPIPGAAEGFGKRTDFQNFSADTCQLENGSVLNAKHPNGGADRRYPEFRPGTPTVG